MTEPRPYRIRIDELALQAMGLIPHDGQLISAETATLPRSGRRVLRIIVDRPFEDIDGPDPVTEKTKRG